MFTFITPEEVMYEQLSRAYEVISLASDCSDKRRRLELLGFSETEVVYLLGGNSFGKIKYKACIRCKRQLLLKYYAGRLKACKFCIQQKKKISKLNRK